VPKSKKKITCDVCLKVISASAFRNHVFGRHHSRFLELIDECGSYAKSAQLCHCGNVILQQNYFNAWMIYKFLNDVSAFRKYCSAKCRIVWNKDETKHSHPSLMKMSQNRMGENNPVHMLISDKEKYDKWRKNISEADGARHWRGKTYEEIHGLEKALEIKNTQSESAKNREVHGHTGIKHSTGTKRQIAIKAAKNNSERQDFVSAPQRKLFNFLFDKFGNRVQLEQSIAWYTADILIDKDIVVEVDGDFYHCNEALGFFPKYKIQKRNLTNDKNKNKFLVENGYTLLRFWQSEIDSDINGVLNRILHVINE